MAYPKREPVTPSHRGAEQQKADYSKFQKGGNTSRATIPEGLHPQAPRNKGYPKPRPK